MMNTVFIYALNCPFTGQTRYVGKADNLKVRFIAHITKAKRENNHRANWIRSVLTKGLKPVLEILDEVPVSEWPQWEVAWIEFYREQGFDLVNATFGGEGNPGRVMSLETRAKIGATRIERDYGGAKHHNFGKTLPAETCNKISASHTGKKHSAETLVKMRGNRNAVGNKNSLGHKHSEETRAKMSATRTGVKKSESHRAAMRAAWVIRKNKK